jgi:hypothetical protein
VKEERKVFGPTAILLESQEIFKGKTTIFRDKTASSIENTTKSQFFDHKYSESSRMEGAQFYNSTTTVK